MALFQGGTATRLSVEQAKHQWPTFMARLEQQLQNAEGEYLFGEPTLADFSMAHLLWFLKGTPVTAPLVDVYPAIHAWLGRVLGFGHGTYSDLTAEEALAIAKAATPAPLPDETFEDPNGFKMGDQVSISAVDYGVDPVQGELLFAGAEELIIRREDARAGVVHVHFPRVGFAITKP